MTDDVTIDRETAQRLAVLLRGEASTTKEERLRLADLLDPPPPSLRDEVELCLRDTVSQWQGEDFFPQTDAVLAVVRKRIEALPVGAGGCWSAGCADVVLALFEEAR